MTNSAQWGRVGEKRNGVILETMMKALMFSVQKVNKVDVKKNIILGEDVKAKGISDIVEDEEIESEKHVHFTIWIQFIV